MVIKILITGIKEKQQIQQLRLFFWNKEIINQIKIKTNFPIKAKIAK